MFKSLRSLFLLLALIASLFIYPVQPAYALAIPAEINKQFTPILIDAGGVSVLRVTIFNPNTFPLTNATWTDNLIGVQPGLKVANPSGINSTCTGGTVTAVPNTTTISLSGGNVPAQVGATPGECYVEINVTSTVAGSLINTIPAANLSASGNDGGTPVTISNTTPASATITVIAVSPPALSKGFVPNTMFVGEVSQLTITLNNNDVDTNLTQTAYTDTLPANVILATPVSAVVTNCGGYSLTAVAGTNTIALSNATVTPSLDCVVKVNVTSTTGGIYTNTIPAGPGGPGSITTQQGVTNGSAASAPLNVQPIGLTKNFTPNAIAAGGTSTLTITLQNPTGANYTGVGLTDNIPAGLTISGGLATTCGAGVVSSTATSVTLTGGVVPASVTPPTPVGTCTITATVQAPLTSAGGTLTNTILPNTITAAQPGVTNLFQAQSNLVVTPALTGTKAYSPTTIAINGVSTATITLTNNSATNLTGVDFTDSLPANLTVSGTPTTPQCNGTISNTATSVTLAGGSILAGTSCTIIFNVTSSVPGSGTTYENVIPTNGIATTQGVGNTSTIRTGTDLTVVNSATLPVTVSKAFQTSPINPGTPSRLRITITAPADTSLSGLTISDILPAGLVVVGLASVPAAPANPTDTCANAAVSAPIGGSTISLIPVAGVNLTAGANCTITVYVTSVTSGSYDNTILANNVVTTETRTNDVNSNTATLVVTSMSMSKAFYPNTVQANGQSTLTITLQNTTTSPLINVQLTDPFPGTVTNGIVVASPANASTTCSGGIVTATPGTLSVSMTGAIVPAQVGAIPGICTITVNVQGKDSSPVSPSTQTNTIPTANVSGTVQSTGTLIRPIAQAQAILNIQPLTIGVVKGFNPVLVYGGAYSTMSVQLVNPNNADLTGVTFTDDMALLGVGMQLASPVTFDVGTCGGVLTGNPGDSSFTFSGGTLLANTSCTLTLRVVMAVNGNLTNRILAGAVTTFNGVSSTQPAEASLTNLPGASVTKSFNPSTILTGAYSELTITIQNTSNIPLLGMALTDLLPGALPNGLEIAGGAAPAPVNNCGLGSTFSAPVGSQTIALTGGTLAGNSSCTLVVSVTSSTPGTYINTIPAGGLTATAGGSPVSNNNPTSATLVVNAGEYSLGNRVWFDTDNSGTINGTEVGVSGVRVELYQDNGDGVYGAGDTFQSFATTDASGYYRFDNLPAGNYVVLLPADNFRNVGVGDTVAGDPLSGYWSSETTINSSGAISDSTANDVDVDVDDSDDNGISSIAANSLTYVASAAITLGPGANSEPITDNDPVTNPSAGEEPNGQSNRTADFGFYREQLGNQIFVDTDNNGTYNAGDTNLSGANVQLFASNGTTQINVGPDGILGTSDDAAGGITTGAGGTYLFSGLPAGDYVVKVTPPVGYASTVDTASPSDTTTPNANTNNNDNGVGTSGGQVSSNPVTLSPGSFGAGLNNNVTNANGTTYDPTMDFGFTLLNYSLGNRVWFDTDNSGTINGTEVGISGVRVELYQDNGDGVYGAGDTFQSFATTDASGYYRFDNLPAGNYVVLLPADNFRNVGVGDTVAGDPLSGYWSSETSISGAGAVSDATANDVDVDVDDSDDNGRTTFTGSAINYVASAAVTLGPGTAEPTGETDLSATGQGSADNRADMTVDFGFYQAALSNQIFVDVDNSGTYNAGDADLSAAIVQLYASDGTTEIQVGPDGIFGTSDDAVGGVTTGAAGTYLFAGLPEGAYIVKVTPPSGYSSTIDTADITDTTNPDTNTNNNDNGVGTGTGQTSSNVVTLTPGDLGTASNNTVTNSTGTTTNPTMDFGFTAPSYSLGNRVWFDTDNSGTINGTEVGISGVRVELYQDNGGTPGVFDGTDTFYAFATTDADGYYRFDNLPAGDYVVLIPADNFRNVGVGDTVPGNPLSGYWSSETSISGTGVISDSTANDADIDVDDSDDNGRTTFTGSVINYVAAAAVTLGPGTAEPTGETDLSATGQGASDNRADMTVDFGFYKVALGNQVFVDVDNGGTFNAGDTNLSGATVQLYASNGTTEIQVGPDGILGTTDDATGGVVTGVGGTYQFSGLPAGSYIVKVTPPVGYTSTQDTADSADTTNPNTNTDNNDNGVGTGSGQAVSNVVTLTPGSVGAATNNIVNNSAGATTDPTVDFGFVSANGFSKSIIGTDQTFTTGNNVAIGEIVTYQVAINLPVGVALNNVTVTDQMDKGLAYVDCLSVIVGGVDLTGTVCPAVVVSSITDPGDLAANPANPGRQVVFNIGDIAAPAAASAIVIQYRAIVLDIIENQETVTLNNNATWAWTGGSFSTSAPNVTIVEPDIAIDKSATPSTVTTGATVQFTLVINHTAPSTADAFDVVVTDILPAGLEYVPCTPITYTGVVPTTQPNVCSLPGGNALTFAWDSFPLNSSATIVFFARFTGSQPSVVNTASVAWTSLPIDPGPGGVSVQLSTFNSTSTERHYDPLDTINVYQISDSVTIGTQGSGGNGNNVALPKQLPFTGFAPSVVTALPEQPNEKSYMATDVWMEIPSLDISIPIVGVPLVDGAWDLSWLDKQAGWLNGTAFPGWEGNSALTGHVYLPNGKPGPFVGLGNLKWGSKIIIHAYGSVYTYEVRENRTVSPDDTSVLKHEEKAWLTLITCKAYNEKTNTYSSRIAVRAALVNVQKEKQENTPRGGR